MNRVETTALEVPLPPWSAAFAGYLENALDALGKTNWDLSVVFCGDAAIRALNSRYRGKDEATDVLSFALGETLHAGNGDAGNRDDGNGDDSNGGERYLAGDIIISLETVRENARYFAVREEEELRRLAIHGILHLDGMDHETNDAHEPMLVLQEKLLNDLDEGGGEPPGAGR
ncbi:MAG: rRNA maturation RNase YbeY [Spirochaetaceae bacterium]|jgi:probable rRNA maturation factor|nr:rRNA maturation RNase YbeY [Spirochaetaceae bacterium]